MMLRSGFFVLGIGAALLASGCRREAIRVYTAPKDAPVPEAGSGGAQADEHAGHDHSVDNHGQAVTATPPATSETAARERPKVTWSLPAGWEETTPGQMSVAQFVIKSAAGEATVNITPLPNLAGKEAMIVNMWREQVGQGPLEQKQIETALTALPVAGGDGQLFEIAGTRDGAPSRIVTAMLHRAEASWFFKLAGSEAGVTAQKEAFLEFLKSVKIGVPASEAPAPAKTP